MSDYVYDSVPDREQIDEDLIAVYNEIFGSGYKTADSIIPGSTASILVGIAGTIMDKHIGDAIEDFELNQAIDTMDSYKLEVKLASRDAPRKIGVRASAVFRIGQLADTFTAGTSIAIPQLLTVSTNDDYNDGSQPLSFENENTGYYVLDNSAQSDENGNRYIEMEFYAELPGAEYNDLPTDVWEVDEEQFDFCQLLEYNQGGAEDESTDEMRSRLKELDRIGATKRWTEDWIKNKALEVAGVTYCEVEFRIPTADSVIYDMPLVEINGKQYYQKADVEMLNPGYHVGIPFFKILVADGNKPVDASVLKSVYKKFEESDNRSGRYNILVTTIITNQTIDLENITLKWKGIQPGDNEILMASKNYFSSLSQGEDFVLMGWFHQVKSENPSIIDIDFDGFPREISVASGVVATLGYHSIEMAEYKEQLA